LSLAYCDIDKEGAPFIQQILAYIKSELKALDLSGNNLQNDGAYNVFRAVEINSTLSHLNLSDNKFGDQDPKLMNKICDVFKNNKSLGVLELVYNGITEEGAKIFLETIKSAPNKTVYKLELNESISKDLITELKALLKKNTPKKGKKKKKKKE